MDSQQTLALHQALSWIHAHYLPIAIFVSGSIVRGNPGPTSDLDIYVLHEQGFRQRVQKRFNGVPCELFINTLAQVYAYFDNELRVNRPVTAHLLTTGRLVYGEDNACIRTLLADAQHYLTRSPAVSSAHVTFRHYGLVTLLEDAADVVATDQPTASYILDKVMSELVELLFYTQQTSLPRLKERLARLTVVAPVVGQLLTQYYQASSLGSKYDVAKQAVMAVTGHAEFFEWSSTPE